MTTPPDRIPVSCQSAIVYYQREAADRWGVYLRGVLGAVRPTEGEARDVAIELSEDADEGNV